MYRAEGIITPQTILILVVVGIIGYMIIAGKSFAEIFASKPQTAAEGSVYVNPLLCVVSGKFCDPNDPDRAAVDAELKNVYTPDASRTYTSTTGNVISDTGWTWLRENDPARYRQLIGEV